MTTSGEQRRATSEGEYLTDANDVRYERKELNGHWVRYTFFRADGQEATRVAMPRVEVFTPEDIAELDERFATEDA